MIITDRHFCYGKEDGLDIHRFYCKDVDKHIPVHFIISSPELRELNYFVAREFEPFRNNQHSSNDVILMTTGNVPVANGNLLSYYTDVFKAPVTCGFDRDVYMFEFQVYLREDSLNFVRFYFDYCDDAGFQCAYFLDVCDSNQDVDSDYAVDNFYYDWSFGRILSAFVGIHIESDCGYNTGCIEYCGCLSQLLDTPSESRISVCDCVRLSKYRNYLVDERVWIEDRHEGEFDGVYNPYEFCLYLSVFAPPSSSLFD